MVEEVIKWIAPNAQLPDDEMTVLINTPSEDEPVWLGYHYDGEWYLADGGDLVSDAVIYWAEMPAGIETTG